MSPKNETKNIGRNYSRQNHTIALIYEAAVSICYKKEFFSAKDIMEWLTVQLKNPELDQIPSCETVGTYLGNEGIRRFISDFYPGVLREFSCEEHKTAEANLCREVRRVLNEITQERETILDSIVEETSLRLHSVSRFSRKNLPKGVKVDGREKLYCIIPDLPEAYWCFLMDCICSYPGFSKEVAKSQMKKQEKYHLKFNSVNIDTFSRTGSNLYENTDFDTFLKSLCLEKRSFWTITLNTYAVENGKIKRREGEKICRVYPSSTIFYEGVHYLQVLVEKNQGWIPQCYRITEIYSLTEEPRDKLWEETQPKLAPVAHQEAQKLRSDPAFVLSGEMYLVTIEMPMNMLQTAVEELGDYRSYIPKGETLRVENVPAGLAKRFGKLHDKAGKVIKIIGPCNVERLSIT